MSTPISNDSAKPVSAAKAPKPKKLAANRKKLPVKRNGIAQGTGSRPMRSNKKGTKPSQPKFGAYVKPPPAKK